MQGLSAVLLMKDCIELQRDYKGFRGIVEVL